MERPAKGRRVKVLFHPLTADHQSYGPLTSKLGTIVEVFDKDGSYHFGRIQWDGNPEPQFTDLSSPAYRPAQSFRPPNVPPYKDVL